MMHSPISPNLELWPEPATRTSLAVLCSGGVDSAVLLGEALSHYRAVYPIYIRTGMSWEGVEELYLRRFLDAVKTPELRALTILEQPVADVYGDHWSITGLGVPDEHSPDEAVFLPGRNALLLVKSLLWCHLNRVPAIAMAPLEANPFPDATPAFFDAFSNAVNMAVGGNVKVLRIFAQLSKRQVISRAVGMPLQYTFSCIRPRQGIHCGRCNKCAERQQAFQSAGVLDPTDYFAVP
jgi:7-cyano-7-deazaguanine synthase